MGTILKSRRGADLGDKPGIATFLGVKKEEVTDEQQDAFAKIHADVSEGVYDLELCGWAGLDKSPTNSPTAHNILKYIDAVLTPLNCKLLIVFHFPITHAV